ncbi:MAG: phosphoglycerate kinase [Candidatus Cloacimonadota bacterium]|nr:MAG: phosphoglycerate kinase [Candidatus Cloacimonadota bacterium]
MKEIPSIQNIDLIGKKVLIRVDHNVVKKGKIIDPYRIEASLATIKLILEKGGKPILMSHVGRPKDKKTGEIIRDAKTSVEPIVEYLNSKLQKKFKIAFENTVDFSKNSVFAELEDNSIDGVYLPNTRWFKGEEDKGAKAKEFAKELAQFADIFVNDAFGSWQPHATTYLITKYLPSYAGLLMLKEIENLKKVLEPQRPFIAIVAGSKFDTKIGPLTALLQAADYLVIGGVIYNAYLCAKYGIKIKGVSDDDILSAQSFVELAARYPEKLIQLPVIIESDLLEEKNEGNFRSHHIHDLVLGTELNFVLDVDPVSFADEKIKRIFKNASTFFTNAVMGFTPNFAEGSKALYASISENKKAEKLFGGGDTLQEFKTLLPTVYNNAREDNKYYFFTGGGTILKAIKEGTPFGLEPVKALIK